MTQNRDTKAATLFRRDEARLGRAWAAAWRERNRAHFDAMDRAGLFWDSRLRHGGLPA